MTTWLKRGVASALVGAVLLFASSAAAQVPGGVGVKPPFVTGDCVKAAGPGTISTAGAPCGGGVGTVTSVNASGGTTGLSFSGGPITTSGTLTLAGGLVVSNGGTGATTLTTNGVLYGNGTSAIGVTAAGTTGQVLIGNTGSAPSWAALSGLGVTSLSFGTTGLTPSSATQGAITVAGTLAQANGGTGNTSYTDGQLLIGNSSGNGLTKATLTAGANVTITNGNGSITIAASGGGSSGCTTAGSATSVLTDNGAGGCTSNPAFQYSSGTATLGTAGSVVGSLALKNATSGTLTLSPPTGALGTVTVTVPAATDTLVNLTGTQTLTGKTIAYASNTLTGVAPTASPTFTGTVTLPQGTVTSSGISGAAFNNGIIGGTTAAAGTFTTLTANTSLTLNGSTALTSASGNGAILVTSTGTQTSGRCVQIDANGNHAAAGAACGTGSGTVNSGTAGQMAYYASSTTAVSGNANATISGGALTLGVSTSAAGSLILSGSTSGAVTIQPQAAAGTYNFTLPTAAGTAGDCLKSGGGGATAMTFGACAAAAAPIVQATSFSATAGNTYCVDTTSGAITATLPASPANGDTILFLDCLQRFSTSNLTLARNSLTIMNSASDLTVSTNNANFHVTYISNGGVTTWIMW